MYGLIPSNGCFYSDRKHSCPSSQHRQYLYVVISLTLSTHKSACSRARERWVFNDKNNGTPNTANSSGYWSFAFSWISWHTNCIYRSTTIRRDIKYVVRPHVTSTGTEIKIREPQGQSSVQERIIAPFHRSPHSDITKSRINWVMHLYNETREGSPTETANQFLGV